MIKLPIRVKNIKYLDKGKRSLVYTGSYKNKKVAIKIKNPDSTAIERTKNEAKYIKLLNKHGIGPKFVKAGKNFLIHELAEGKQYIDFIKTKKEKNLTLQIIEKCRTLDKLKINKLEFTRPIKHFFVKDNKITMIDFERCYKTDKPKNLTQFCNFLNLKKLYKIPRKILIEYKDKPTEKNFKKIRDIIGRA